MTDTLCITFACALLFLPMFPVVCTKWGMRLAWAIILIGLAYLTVSP